MRKKLRIDGVVTPEDARGQYVYLPFEVPAGARRIEVNYHYENQVVGAQEFNPGNNIDIGVFDVRGSDFLHGGFRGWSGGARSAFFIAPRRGDAGLPARAAAAGRVDDHLRAVEDRRAVALSREHRDGRRSARRRGRASVGARCPCPGAGASLATARRRRRRTAAADAGIAATCTRTASTATARTPSRRSSSTCTASGSTTSR